MMAPNPAYYRVYDPHVRDAPNPETFSEEIGSLQQLFDVLEFRRQAGERVTHILFTDREATVLGEELKDTWGLAMVNQGLIYGVMFNVERQTV